jgi:hypothetical protein
LSIFAHRDKDQAGKNALLFVEETVFRNQHQNRTTEVLNLSINKRDKKGLWVADRGNPGYRLRQLWLRFAVCVAAERGIGGHRLRFYWRPSAVNVATDRGSGSRTERSRGQFLKISAKKPESLNIYF